MVQEEESTFTQPTAPTTTDTCTRGSRDQCAPCPDRVSGTFARIDREIKKIRNKKKATEKEGGKKNRR
jgi:hypothetical protein